MAKKDRLKLNAYLHGIPLGLWIVRPGVRDEKIHLFKLNLLSLLETVRVGVVLLEFVPGDVLHRHCARAREKPSAKFVFSFLAFVPSLSGQILHEEN